MLKKILFLGFTTSILIFSNNLFAEINSIVPLKKPVLTKEEVEKKIEALKGEGVHGKPHFKIDASKGETMKMVKIEVKKES